MVVVAAGRLATGSQDHTLRIWDVDTGECMKLLHGHTDTIRSLQVLRDGFLASGSKDKSIRLWHVNSGTLVYSIEEAHAKVRYHRRHHPRWFPTRHAHTPRHTR
jgi:WD40 repeat protein